MALCVVLNGFCGHCQQCWRRWGNLLGFGGFPVRCCRCSELLEIDLGSLRHFNRYEPMAAPVVVEIPRSDYGGPMVLRETDVGAMLEEPSESLVPQTRLQAPQRRKKVARRNKNVPETRLQAPQRRNKVARRNKVMPF